MQWPEHEVTNWREFSRIADALTVDLGSDKAYLFRGQPDPSWTLKPSLQRCLPEDISADDAIRIETEATNEFQSQAHLHVTHSVIPPNRSDLASWWALMQHHGAPTRLLDWTYSPHIAAYFAVERGWEQDGIVWLFHAQKLISQMSVIYPGQDFVTHKGQQEEYFRDPTAPKAIVGVQRLTKTDRMIVQRGVFLTCKHVIADHMDAIADALHPINDGKSTVFMKIIIPGRLKPDFLRHLRAINVTANSLFPGIDGLGRSISEFVRNAS